MATITLLHTSPAHVPTFEALAVRIAPGTDLEQIVREDWLKRAREHGLRQGIRREIADVINESQGTVICTCTTIGPAAEEAGAIRIDAPMMEKAARIGGPILMAYALQSTAKPSLELLEEALERQGTSQVVRPLFLGEFWPLFEAGEHEAFTACIAGAIRNAAEADRYSCIIIAQGSMTGAGELLSDLDIPVLTSPELALRTALLMQGSART